MYKKLFVALILILLAGLNISVLGDSLTKIYVLSLSWDPASEDIINTVNETFNNVSSMSRVKIEILNLEDETTMQTLSKYNVQTMQGPGVVVISGDGKVLLQGSYKHNELNKLKQELKQAVP